MKKFLCSALTICMLSTFSLNEVSAAETKPVSTPAETPIPPEIQLMIDRVYEIKEMDKSSLTIAERKELKKELRAIKHDLKAVTGIYLSIGALIIIILLLILIL